MKKKLNMIKVGLTGNYCSGYNDMAKLFEDKGVPVFDADLVTKYLIYRDSVVISKIKNKFGKSAFVNNKVSMTRFQGKEKFVALMKLIEFDLIKAFERWRHSMGNNRYVIFKSQILFELEWNKTTNFTVAVFRPNGFRSTDIQKKCKISTTDAWKLIDSEMDVFQKNRLADYSIHNYESYAQSIDTQISLLHRTFCSKI